MIMDLPSAKAIRKHYRQDDVYIEGDILKFRDVLFFKKIIYILTYELYGKEPNCKCRYCNRIIGQGKMTLDHMYPRSVGGPTITNNLLISCMECNEEKTNMTIEEYRKYLLISDLEEREDYVKYVQEQKEQLQKEKKYQLPSDWITEKKTSEIGFEKMIFNPKNTAKYRSKRVFFETHGYLKRPITVDRNNYILEGFYNLLIAKENGMETVPVIQLENVERFVKN